MRLSLTQRNFSRTAFELAAKKQQRAFRSESHTISADAKDSIAEKGWRNPHLLALRHEEENLYPGIRGIGGAIDFLGQRNIKWWKNAGSGDDAQTGGPTRNMASSQVACVNFLLPLAGISGALAAALRALDGDVRAVVDIHHEGRSSPVEFEWLGIPRSLEGGRTRGAQNTSIDAFLMAETTSGRRRAYLLEWKYSEHCQATRPAFKGDGKAGGTRRLRYAERFRAPYSAFNPDAVPDLDDFLYEPFYQLMRQRLLADRMVRERELDVDEAKVVVVVPEENLACRRVGSGTAMTSPRLVRRFPHLETVEEAMRASLKEPEGQFSMAAPSALLDGVARRVPDETAVWARYWRDRYGV